MQLLHGMLTDVLIERPEDAIDFCIDWLKAKKAGGTMPAADSGQSVR